MSQTNTLIALKERWGFSDQFICQFFEPFLSGIYLSPLSSQSSRMFHFIFKMFAQGSACLPANGMKAVGEQLGDDLGNYLTGMDVVTDVKVSAFEEVRRSTEALYSCSYQLLT